MKCTVARRLAASGLSLLLAVGGAPTSALAEVAAPHALSTQAAGTWSHEGGRWTYRLASGLATGWQDVDGTWYLFNDAGTMLTGWQMVNGTWYLLSDAGAMLTGWQWVNGAWYLLNDAGAMLTGWQWVNGAWYLLNETGAMLTGWRKVNGTWYLLGDSGAMLTGWQLEGNTWYYLLPSGAMATGWAFINGAWYYFYPASGAMAQSTEVDGYWLRSDGVWDDSDRIPGVNTVIAQLTVAQDVDPLATEAVVRVESDLPFAQNLSASTIALHADWEGASVANVRRDGATTAYVTVTGISYDADDGMKDYEHVGSIKFNPGSFADEEAEGVVGVNVIHQAASVLDAESAYVNESFVLTVSLGSAQLPGADNASAFSLPANPEIQVTGATNVDYGNSASITLKVPGNTPYEQFSALDNALTQGGLQITGTTAGTQVAYGAKVNRESELSYTKPQLTAYIERGMDGKGWEMDSQGNASLHLVVRVVSTGGDPDLTESHVTFADEGLVELIGGSFTLPSSAYQKEFVVSLSADELAELQSAYGVEDAASFLDLYAYQLAGRMAQGVSVAGGITNTWGIELPDDVELDTTVYNLVGLGESWETDVPLWSDEVTDENERMLETQASKDDAKKASEALKYSSEVLKVIGTFATAFKTFEKTGVGGFITGAGSIVGIISTIVDTMTPTTWSIADVMKQVLAIDGRLDTITSQLGNITYQLDKLEKSVDYKTQVGTLTQLAQQGLAYRPWVTSAMSALKDATDRDSYKIADGDSTPSGKALKKLYNQTQQQSRLTAGGKSAYQVASELADAITGNGATQLSGGARSFFDYTASNVNWEPETFYARGVFLSYVGGAFTYAYLAASNELNQQIAATSDETTKAVFQQNLSSLMDKADAVNKLIGEDGSLMPQTRDRSDGTVLCTVNNLRYKKYNGWNGDHPALVFPWDNSNNASFTNVFGDLMSSRDEDKEKSYSHQSTMSRSDLETMAKRESYVRTIPGYENATSIFNEFNCVGLVALNTWGNGMAFGKTWNKTSISCNNDHQMSYAIVGDPSRTEKSDSASVSHKRTYSADMYDIKNNRSVGKVAVYDYDVYYGVIPAYWYVKLNVYSFTEIRAV